ncbi:MAG: MMPL family transporter [Proteobacteria bacterium]|nr:MMPL family transporter [Pseudomonadota bacterium]
MILSDISVKRPVFATVISLLLVTFGVMFFQRLPLREYPDIDPPVVSVTTSYPGASAAVVESKVTQIIEDQISGIEGIRTIESSSQDGRSSINIEFTLNRDIDAAANDIRDRVSRVLGNLPEEVDAPEVAKSDSDNSPIMWLNLSSTKMNGLELTDFADRYLVDKFSVVDGVARVRIGGERRYAMRIWIDRNALAARDLTVADLENALRRENVELPAGRLESKQMEYTVRVARLYNNATDFSALVLKMNGDGTPVRLGDVARVEVGAEDERNELRGNGQDMIGLGIVKQSKANTLAVARGIREKMAEVQEGLPEGTNLYNSYDSSVFIEEAIKEVYFTLFIAMVLVVGVIYIFLGNVRTVLVPAVTVPVSLVASSTVLFAMGYSVNLLTLLALVLAIGLVVDDAIVVLENVVRRIQKGEPALLAAARGTRQVGFAVLATTFVLIAVFIPIGLMQGNVGRLFTEFAFALSGAVAFSCLIALTLSPMMCSKLLSRKMEHNALTGRLDKVFDRLHNAYEHSLQRVLQKPLRIAALVALSIPLVALLLKALPSEFAPTEDRGVFYMSMKAPEGAGFEYSQKYMRQIEADLMELVDKGEATRTLARVPGSFGAAGDVNSGRVVVVLSNWADRKRTVQQISGELAAKAARLAGVRAFPILPQGLGQRGSGQPVQFVLGGTDYKELAVWRDKVLEKARENPGLIGVDADYEETKPQFHVSIDRDRAADLGVSLADIGRTLETMLGSRQVTTYIDRGEEYDVILQSAQEGRQNPQDLTNIYVRSSTTGHLVPLSNLLKVEPKADASTLMRFNRLRAITISAGLAEGYTLGEALDFLNDVAKTELPGTAQLDYKGQSREFMESSGALMLTFGLALLIAFLVLAAQFESFIHPLVIIFTVPLAVLGALMGLVATGGTMNIYSQIGMVMLIGLCAKNGILIVEFANQLRDEGLPFDKALVTSAVTRLRPIMMTSISTALGAVPLIMTSGAGAESRVSIGVVVFCGVVFSTVLTLYVVPVFYHLMARNTGSPRQREHQLEKLEVETPQEI